MIDLTKITNFKSTHAELQEILLCWCFAAGHSGISAAKGVDKFLKRIGGTERPFHTIEQWAHEYGWGRITELLSQSGLGCWKIKSRTVRELVEAKLNLKTCSIADLEAIFGIGKKTSRCFLLHSRPDQRLAGLDTHNLKYLASQGIAVPKSTPTGKKYETLEQEWLKLCDEAGEKPATFDLKIWNHYRQNGKTPIDFTKV